MQEVKDKHLTVCLGNTRSGKSTIVNYLMLNPLIIQEEVIFEGFNIVKACTLQQGPEIGKGTTSKTTFLTCWESPKILGLIVDAPGFEDNRGEVYDISSAFYIKKLLENAKSVRIVLVSDINDIRSHSVAQFTNLISKICTILPNIMNYAPGIALVFSKSSNKISAATVAELLTEKILHSDINMKSYERDFVDYFVRNSHQIGFFKMPTSEGEINYDTSHFEIGENIFSTINNEIKKLDGYNVLNVKPGISDKSRIFLLEARENLAETNKFDHMLSNSVCSFKDHWTKYYHFEYKSSVGKNRIKEIYGVILAKLRKISSEENLVRKIELFYTIDPEARVIPPEDIFTKLDFIGFIDDVLELKHSRLCDTVLDSKISELDFFISDMINKIRLGLGEIPKKEADFFFQGIKGSFDSKQENLREKKKL